MQHGGAERGEAKNPEPEKLSDRPAQRTGRRGWGSAAARVPAGLVVRLVRPDARYMGSMTPLSGGPVMKGIIFAR